MKALTLLAVALLVAACSMASSSIIPEDANLKEFSCRSNLGYYHLAKSYLELRVDRKFRSKPAEAGAAPTTIADYRIRLTGVHTRPDPDARYCLDYHPSITSDDSVRVWKTDGGLLEKISSRADDQSLKAIEKLLQTIFTFAAGSPVDGAGLLRSNDDQLQDRRLRWHEVFKAQFDPTNHFELNRINDRLKDMGFCLVTESQAMVGPSASKYCEAPLSFAEFGPGHPTFKKSQTTKTKFEVPQQLQAAGIIYRPRMPFQIYLFHRPNRKIRGMWRLRRQATIEIENHAPLVSVGIDRTFFAQRETVLSFDQGMLKDVQVFKTSPLQNAIVVPLKLVQYIAYLPANIIQVRINQTEKEREFRRAEKELFEAMTNLEKKRQNPGSE